MVRDTDSMEGANMEPNSVGIADTPCGLSSGATKTLSS